MKELRCNHVHLGHPHMDHRWEMQPGMDPVHCPGLDCRAPVPDPRELGLQWEDRITDAVHPAGGRTWTYQERSDLVLDAVRELLHERITPLLEEITRLAGDLEEFREEVSGERQQRRFQEMEDRGRRDALTGKLDRVHGYVNDCLGFGDEIDAEHLLGILEGRDES